MSVSPEVIQQLVDSHRQFLGFLQKRVESREVAEDILQTAFVKSLERGAELRDNESAVAWFYSVPRNATIDHYRRRDSTQRAYEQWGKEFISSESPAGYRKRNLQMHRWTAHNSEAGVPGSAQDD